MHNLRQEREKCTCINIYITIFFKSESFVVGYRPH